MSINTRANQILKKLDDPDCLQLAEKEMKSFIVNEIDSGEKLNFLINSIADEKNYASKKTQFFALKLFIAIAEIFQHQILEFLPKIFVVLNKKILISEESTNDIIAECYGGIIEFSFKGASLDDANFVFNECLHQLNSLFDRNTRNVQICAGMCIKKILQNSLVEIVENNFDEVYQNLCSSLKSSNEKYTIIESLMTLVLTVQSRVEDISDDLINTLVEYISDENYKTRKICIDLFYGIFAISPRTLEEYNDQIHEILQHIKSDKNKHVREAAIECLKLLSAPNKSKIVKERKSATPKKTKKFQKRKSNHQFVNENLKFDHVRSQIDKRKINKNFVKNEEEINDIVIFAKKPPTPVEYQRAKPVEAAPMVDYVKQRPERTEPTNNYLNEPVKPKSNYLHEPVEPTEQFEVEPTHKMFSDDEPKPLSTNPSRMLLEKPVEHTNLHSERQVVSRHNDSHMDANGSQELRNLKKYIKVLNGKVKLLHSTCEHLSKVNNELVGKVAVLETKYEGLHRQINTRSTIDYASIQSREQHPR